MKITVLPGDGVGVEVTREAVRVLTEISASFNLKIEFEPEGVGYKNIFLIGPAQKVFEGVWRD